MAIEISKLLGTYLELKFKLALLVIIEDVLLGGDKKRNVRGWVVRLLEEVDEFLNYPWGRIVYEATHSSLIGAIENRIAHGVKGDKERNNYNLHGFPLAFQVWIYEVEPMIGLSFAKQLSRTVYPRCLRWASSNGGIDYETVARRLQEGNPDGIQVEARATLKAAWQSEVYP